MARGDLLVPFGFTALESEVYTFLVGEHPATGYRIAQGIGKPVANTYKALQTLERKGAVLVEAGRRRSVTPVPPEELLSRLAKQFEGNRLEAQKRFASLTVKQGEDQTLAVRSVDGALQRARAMLSSASQSVVVAASPGVTVELATDLVEAASRVAFVGVVCSNCPDLAGVRRVIPAPASGYAAPAGEVMALAVDGREALVLRAETEASAAGLWTNQAASALAIYYGLVAEFTLGEVAEKIEEGAGTKRLTRALVVVPKL